MIDTLSDIELSNELSRLIRQVAKLKTSINNNPKSPSEIVDNASAQNEITELTERQTTIGALLLERDNAAQKRKAERLTATAIKGKAKADELLDRLPEFSDKVAIAFNALGAEYDQLLKLSTEIRKVNNELLNANLPQCIQASVKIEPNSLYKLLKEQFRESFGVNTTDVLLPQKTEGFDIVEAVADIKQVCK